MELELILPTTMAGKRDIVRVQRDIEKLLEERLQSDIAQKQGGEARKVNPPTPIVKYLFQSNKIEMTNENLQRVDQYLESVRQNAPTIRIAFASEPDKEVTQKIVKWFRTSVDKRVLIQIGIQPIIAGGCVVQTPMKRYDFSLRQHLLNSTDKFTEVMNSVS